MKKGDILRVSIIRVSDIGPDHFGIYDGEGGVYHFQGFDFDTALIKHTTLEEFENGGKCTVCSYYEKEFSDDVIVERAASYLGENFGGYNLITNNCEHFATWCATGKKMCMQTSIINGEHETDDQNIVSKYKEYQAEKYKDIGAKINTALASGEINDDVKQTMQSALNYAMSSGLLNNLLKK